MRRTAAVDGADRKGAPENSDVCRGSGGLERPVGP